MHPEYWVDCLSVIMVQRCDISLPKVIDAAEDLLHALEVSRQVVLAADTRSLWNVVRELEQGVIVIMVLILKTRFSSNFIHGLY